MVIHPSSRWRGRLTAAVFAVLSASVSAQAFDVQGHRGARGLAPENTLAGFRTALAAGATTWELDIGLTRDGVVVVMHDRRLNPDLTRGPGGSWIEPPGATVASLTVASGQSLSIGTGATLTVAGNIDAAGATVTVTG